MPSALHVDRHGADRLDDVGEHVRAARVRERAHRLRVVHEAVHVRHQRQRHQPRVLVDRAVHVVHVDRPVAVLHDAELHAFLLELLVHVERRREMQLVDHDVAAAPRQVHPHDDDVLAVGGAGGVGDLVGGGADQLAVALLQILLLVGAEVDAPRAGAVQPVAPRPARWRARRRCRAGASRRSSCRCRARPTESRRAPRRGRSRRAAWSGRAANTERADTASAPAPARNSRRPSVMRPPEEPLG